MKITKISLKFYSTNSFFVTITKVGYIALHKIQRRLHKYTIYQIKKKQTTHSYINKKSYNINLQLILAIFYLLNQVIPIICKALLPRQNLPF